MNRREFLKTSTIFGGVIITGISLPVIAKEVEKFPVTELCIEFGQILRNDPKSVFYVLYDDEIDSNRIIARDIQGNEMKGDVNGRKHVIFDMPYYEEFPDLFIPAIGYLTAQYISVTVKLKKESTIVYMEAELEKYVPYG